MTHQLMRLVLLALCATRALAAEPQVDSSQLPRVPPTPPEKAMSTFKVKPGFRIELVAAEPLVVSPVAMSFDEDGRLYVIEMRDYSERRPERLGRVRLLEDTDGDGRFDKSSVFAEGLPWPTAVTCWAGGVFVGATPDIVWMKDTTGDGVADEREVIFTGFASDYAPFSTNKLNVQALMNSFQWTLDNRIHGATSFSGGKVMLADSPFVRAWMGRAGLTNFQPSTFNSPLDVRGRDFSFDPRTLSMRPESGGGQHGMSFDNRGRKFVCSNSDHIQQIVYEDRYAARNPYYSMPSPRVSIAADGPAAEVFRISPDEPWRVLRTQWRVAGKVSGPVEGGGRASGYFTGATGVTIYRGDAYGEDFVDNAFIGDAGGNLVHRKKLHTDGILMRAERPADERNVEFLASTDNWFRPVQFANAPDGCLYIADMYREVIEHPWSLPPNLKKHLDLNSGNDRGRIYRIVRWNFQQRPPSHLSKASATDLVKLLASRNGWHRDTAARLLYERQDSNTVAQIRSLWRTNARLDTIHALHCLAGLRAVTAEDLSKFLLRASDVCIHALRVAEETSLLADPKLQPELEEVWRRNSDVQFQLALSLSALQTQRLDWLAWLAGTDSNRWVQAAVVNAVGDRSVDLFEELMRRLRRMIDNDYIVYPVLEDLAHIIGATAPASDLQRIANRLTPWASSPNGSLVAVRFLEGIRESKRSFQREGLTKTLAVLFETAAFYATNAQIAAVPEITRVNSVRLIGLSGSNAPPLILSLLLDIATEDAVWNAALTEIGRFGGLEPAEQLIGRWSQFSPKQRGPVMEFLLKRRERIPALLAAVERGVVEPNEFTTGQLQSLRSNRDSAIRERADKLFGRAATTARQSVIEAFQPALALKGDVTNGRKLFQARCASCHKFGSDGHALGPDLATVRSGGKEKLLIAILDPNREVAPNFASYSIETKDGESLTGILASEGANSVTLRMAGGAESIVARANTASMQSQGRSLMPEGLEEGLKPQDMADLLEFILTDVR